MKAMNGLSLLNGSNSSISTDGAVRELASFALSKRIEDVIFLSAHRTELWEHQSSRHLQGRKKQQTELSA